MKKESHVNQIYEELKKTCINKHPMKMFTPEEIEGIYLLLSDGSGVSKSKIMSYFHCKFEKIDKIIELLKDSNDFEKIAKQVNGGV